MNILTKSSGIILKKMLNKNFLDDTEGRTCKGRHDKVLCQYEIHKAIVAIERGRFLSHSRLNR